MARYLKRRKRGWYFQLEIPAHLREHFGGRARVEQTLSTRDERLAEAKAKQLAGEYKLRFLALEGVSQAKQALTRSTYDDSVKAVLENEILAFGRPEDDPVDLGVELAVDKILDKPGRRYDEDGDPILSVPDPRRRAIATGRRYRQGIADFRERYRSHLPVALDGSNSGLQHLTALLRDAKAAPEVNLVDQDRPGDLYATVAARAQQLVDLSSDPGAEPWKGDRITRKIVKRPCMTYVYSATRMSMADQIRETLEELDEENTGRGELPHLRGADNEAAAFWLSGVLYKLIETEVPAARRAMDWLRKTMGLLNKADLPIWWTTPVGLPVLQSLVLVRQYAVNISWTEYKIRC